MKTTFEKRFSHGFYLLSNWTWSHGLDNVGGDGGANGPVPQDPHNRRADWSGSNSDSPHRVNLAATYLLPLGPGRKFANGGGGPGPGGGELGRWGLARAGTRLPGRMT